MKRSIYFNFIEDRLNHLATRIISRGKLNILDLHGHSENFYQYLLNEVYSWDLKNENANKQNVEAIDLIDIGNKLIIQVSATATKQKIESSLSKDSIKQFKEYTYKFVSIAINADDLRKNKFNNPHGIKFDPFVDIIDNKSILTFIKNMNPESQKRVYQFIKKELGAEIDAMKMESNLASIINILSKEDLDNIDFEFEINSFEIDRKISFNNLTSAKLIIEDYFIHYGRVDRIYSEFDSLGSNKSKSVLASIRQEYAKAKSNLKDDQLFFEIISKIEEKVINSANYIEIPIEELELCLNVLVVDAFIRCKIFENPNNYAATR